MFVQDDLLKFKQFRTVLNEADFEIKGSATIQVALLFQWYNSLETKIIEDIKPKDKPKTKEPKSPVINQKKGK